MKDTISQGLALVGLAGLVYAGVTRSGWIAVASVVVILIGGAIYVNDKGQD